MSQLMRRNASTLSRELRRNACAPEGYASASAHATCRKRRIQARPLPKLHPDEALWQTICTLLCWCWSPQQIAATLRRMHPDEPSSHVSHEAIYTAICAYPRGELRRQLIALLCQGKSTRRPRSAGQDRRGQIPERVSIHVRPPEIEDRSMSGLGLDPIPRTGIGLILKPSRVQGYPRRRASLATNAKPRWVTRCWGRDRCSPRMSPRI